MDCLLREFKDLSLREFHDVLSLRVEVFVVEQDCPYQEVDGLDPQSMHLLGVEDSSVIAYARWYESKDEGGTRVVRLGRVVTSPKRRGTGLGHAIVKESLAAIGPHEILIHAQCQLEGFYREHGFIPEGEAFDEDDIPHIAMRRTQPTPGRARN